MLSLNILSIVGMCAIYWPSFIVCPGRQTYCRCFCIERGTSTCFDGGGRFVMASVSGPTTDVRSTSFANFPLGAVSLSSVLSALSLCSCAACTDSFGTPRAVGEVWKASKDGCCMYRCDNDTIVPMEYNCTAVPQPHCLKAGEVIISLADDKSCCPQRVCGASHSLQ